MTARPDWLGRLFRSVDQSDADALVAFMTDEASFKFANAPVLRGKPAIREMLIGFFDSIKGLEHQLADTWQQDGAVICHGTVTYTRHDESTLTVPFANIFRLKDNLIDEYMIYVDASQLYASAD